MDRRNKLEEIKITLKGKLPYIGVEAQVSAVLVFVIRVVNV